MSRGVTVSPVVVEAYRKHIDQSVDDKGARIAIERDILDYAEHRRATATPRVDPQGAEIWRAGPHRVVYHVHPHAAQISVVRCATPHARWAPITATKAASLPGTRRHLELGHAMRHQRERVGMERTTLAGLAGLEPRAIDALESGAGVPDRALAAVCDVLDVDVLVRRRLR